MGREFGCTECGARITIHFSRPGETVTCRTCNAPNTVPEFGQEPPIAPRPVPAPEAAPPASPAGPISGVGVFSSEPLSVGLVLRESFRIFFAEFPKVAALAAIAAVPLLTYQILAAWAGASGPGGQVAAGLLIIALIPVLFGLTQLSSAALTYGAFQALRGQPMAIGRCLEISFRRFWPVLLASLLVGFSVLLGLLLLIVPGIIFFVRLVVTIPVVIVEGASATDATRRSRDLGRGSGGMIFGLLVVIWMLSFVANLVTGLIPSLWGLRIVATTAAAVANSGLYSIAVAVLYYALRSRKESIGVDEIAAVFE